MYKNSKQTNNQVDDTKPKNNPFMPTEPKEVSDARLTLLESNLSDEKRKKAEEIIRQYETDNFFSRRDALNAATDELSNMNLTPTIASESTSGPNIIRPINDDDVIEYN